MVTVTGIAPGATGVVSNIGKSSETDRTRCGQLRLAAVFGEGMVLQRNKPIAVFGQAPAGAKLHVVLTDTRDTVIASNETHAAKLPSTSPAQSICGTTAGMDTSFPWLATLPALPAGGPYTLSVSCETDMIVCRDVMIGEVWLAGGQSNIEFELHNSLGGAQAIEQAHDSLIRFYNVPKTGVIDEAAEAASQWQVALAPQVAHMSAVAYHFAATLRQELGPEIPIGIIDCYIGGTSISCWIGRDTLERSPEGRAYVNRYDQATAGKSMAQMREETDQWQAVFDRWNNDVAAIKQQQPGMAQPQIDAILGPCPWPPPVTPFSERALCAPFNGMVLRVAPYTIAGVLWYQGEEDEPYCESYETLLRALICEWRALWSLMAYRQFEPAQLPSSNESLPFLIVQLPQWIDARVAAETGDPMRWPVIRDAQAKVAQDTAGAAIICTMDCGEFDNIHPIDKRTVGNRLAQLAARQVYAMENHALSPVLESATTDGHTVLLRFAHDEGLHFRSGIPSMASGDGSSAPRQSLPEGDSGFEIAGTDGVFQPAQATILADNTVLVSAAKMDGAPSQIRYAWRSWGPAPLFNGDGLPAFPSMQPCTMTPSIQRQ